MVEVRRNRDDFEYNTRGPPVDNMNDQKVLFHLALKDKHDSCGVIHKRAREIVSSDHATGGHRSDQVMDTLRFLYDACIVYRVDKDTWDKFRSKRVRADHLSRQLSDQLVPHVHDKPDSESVNNVQNTSEFQLLKRMEQEYGRPFHQTLQDHIHNTDQLKGHLFYDEDA